MFPLNFTELRRAIAFALDKEAISDDYWEGLGQPLDSPIPSHNPFSIEGQLDYTYYTADSDTGNALLDSAGFYDIDSDGFREAPDGSDFDILAEFPLSGGIGVTIAPLLRDAFESLGLNGTTTYTDFYEYLNRLYFHGAYDMVFLGESFSNFDVDWLGYEFWREYWDLPYCNYPRWTNSSYDLWRDQLLFSTSYDEVYEAAIEMQKVFVHECPYIILYQNSYISAYRNDRFEGFVNDFSEGIPSFWTNYKAHLKSGSSWPFGGTLRWSNPLDLDEFNFMVTHSCYCFSVSNWLYDPLIRSDPNGYDIPWIAESYKIETHSDNPSIQDGFTRITFDILDNAIWSDGIPLTAEDVAYTFNYYRDAPGNPLGADLQDLVAAYAPTPFHCVIEFNTESYWHLHVVGDKPIIPKHVFTEIGLEAWNTWHPNPPEETMVTSGAFNVTGYEPGEYVELGYIPSYFYSPNRDDWTAPNWNTTTTDPGIDPVLVTSWLVTGGSVIVIIGVMVLWLKEGA
jgi:ABC-type transport system substrate-binding protein